MIRTVMILAVAMGLLWSGTTSAQTTDNTGAFDALSPGGQDHASALTDAHLDFTGISATQAVLEVQDLSLQVPVL